MPLAVTTQGETLWLGLTRSSMVRVPHVVSSPEIAPEPQRIDATNLASDRMVYVRGIKDYSGDLQWEANAQHYTSGGLRDLMAMDGQKVYVERRMPLVGVRVSFEGTATIAMSSASPDSVQHVTIKVAPSSSMAVEEWDSDTSDGWMVRIRTDAAGMNVTRVDMSCGGRDLSNVVTSSTRAQGASNIPSAWDWNGGVGPFGCFYGAFNIDAYSAGTETEEPICTEAGRIAYRLDPYNLERTIGGTTLAGTYNVLLVIPTIYWKSVADSSSCDLCMSSSASYARGTSTVSNMVAYAHTAVSDGAETVYPYIGIGVYEASDDGTRLLSKPGATPSVSKTHDEFKALADALTPATGCDYQQWNFYQWTLLKAMAYAVMGTKNSTWMLGAGPVSGSEPSATGLADEAGPYADSTDGYSKIFIENPWGSVGEILGDAYSSDGVLCAGQSLGGAVLGGQAAVSGATLAGTTSFKWVTASALSSEYWDIPTETGSDSTADDPTKTGAQTLINPTGARGLNVGGRYNSGTGAGIGQMLGGSRTSDSNGFTGARLSYFINDYALGGDAE